MQRGRIHLTQEFVHAISHDFRTSLSNIETNRYLIGRKSKDTGNLTLVSHLDTIQLYVKRMSQQLDGMTAIADLGDMKFSPSSLNFLLEQIKVAYRSVAAAHHIDLRVKPCAKDVTVNMDSSKVQLAIRCLVDNALIYTQPGGQITLEITCNEHNLVIAISDNGEGIHPDHLPYIFNLFYRADPARNVHKGGVGIGLSLVRFVAEAHHGTINVTSEPGQGSTFELVLPYTPAQPQADHQTDQTPSQDIPTNGKRYQEII
jgi:signal transduction histidine kinase